MFVRYFIRYIDLLNCNICTMFQNSDSIQHPFRTAPPVFAIDRDQDVVPPAEIGYKLDGGHIVDGNQYFTMNSETGELIPLLELSRNQHSQFILRIKVLIIPLPAPRARVGLLFLPASRVCTFMCSFVYLTHSGFWTLIPVLNHIGSCFLAQ